ncbi:MAG: OPT family oligopeptide transporter [Thermoguttaceae bacterium]
MTRHVEARPPEDEFEVAEETIAADTSAASQMPTDLSEEAQAAWWMKNVYCGDRMPQLTFRSLVAATVIGALMAVSNLYVGLKSGWGLGVTITAAVMAFAMFKSLETILPGLRKNPLTMLENCTILSFASASGAISSAGLVSAIPALYLCTGRPMLAWQMMAWLFCVASLGLAMAVPLKRQLINVDKLAFPTGTATAETLRSLHSTGAKAMQQAKTLVWCGILGIGVKFWAEGLADLAGWLGGRWRWAQSLVGLAPPESYALFPGERGHFLLKRYSIGFEPSTIFIAAGAIMGIRVGVSMLAGTVIFFGVLAPTMDHLGVLEYATNKTAFRTITEWTLWPAVALMVTAGLTNFALRWRMIAHAVGELSAIFGKKGRNRSQANRTEVPMAWFVVGMAVAGAACVALGVLFFGIHWWMAALAVALTFLLSIVAARATGETDTTPIGAMGKITQLTYGVIDPGNMTTNLMTAGITAGAACHSADLLQSLKTGYLVGASAIKQAIAQFLGIAVGAVVCVLVYVAIVRTPEIPQDQLAAMNAKPGPTQAQLPPPAKQTEAALAVANGETHSEDLSKTNLCGVQFPAPSVTIWRSVAEVLAKGISNLPRYSVLGMAIGGILGICIALLEDFAPKRYAKWIPSATGLGLAGVISPQNSIAMFLGALIAWIWMKRHPKSCEDYMVSGASGLIAGESLMGVGMSLVTAARALLFR